MKVEITLLVGALGLLHHARGHGQMYNPTPWQATSDCSDPNPGKCHWDLKIYTDCTGNCHGDVKDKTLTIGEYTFSTNYTMVPEGMEATLEPEDMFDEWLAKDRRGTWTGPWVTDPWGHTHGTFRLNPWNSPGSAPVKGNGCGVAGGNPDGCNNGGDEVLGQCCGIGNDCGGYSGGFSARRALGAEILGVPHVTTWTRGEAAEVYWKSNGFHRGGYAYRLCQVHHGQYWKVTEECFQQGHLNFSGDTSWLYWKPWLAKFSKWGWIPMESKTTKIGTTPEGSEWAKVNLPNKPSTGDYWAFKDLVEVPTTLAPGDYVLSFRYDCLESPQIWNACANIKIE